MIKLYGISRSRASRSLWALEEIGVEYENVPTHFSGDTKKPEFLALNPNGRVPVLTDGEVTLFESMAINLYLAKKYDGGLQPKTLEDEARAVQWSFWGMTELEAHLIQMLLHWVMLPEAERDASQIEAAAESSSGLSGCWTQRWPSARTCWAMRSASPISTWRPCSRWPTS